MFERILKNNTNELTRPARWACSLTLLATLGLSDVSAHAVTDVTNVPLASVATVKNNDSELLDSEALEKLVAPIALYPDDLIAIVLPASKDPVGVVLAARRLEEEQPQSQNNHDTQPVDSPQLGASQAIDDLRHYPDVLAKMNVNLNWTRALGEAASSQQGDLLDAIKDYRKAAADSGFLTNDEHQVVEIADDTVVILPRDPQVIYVPDHSPRQVVVYRTAPRRAMRYHSTPSPVHYRRYNSSPRYHRATQVWHGPTFTLAWRDGHIRPRHRGHSNNRYYRSGQRHYLHNSKPQRSKHNHHYDNRQHGYIDHRPRNKRSTHNNRRHHSSRNSVSVDHNRRSNRGFNHRDKGERLHNDNQRGNQSGRQRGQQQPSHNGRQQQNRNGARNTNLTSSANESKQLRAWK